MMTSAWKLIDAKGNSIFMDAGVDDGGHDSGFRPMQLLLGAFGGCSAIDLISDST
jgi:putative redox protein